MNILKGVVFVPFINVKTNAKLNEAQKLAVENALSDAISLIPGKSDRYLMLAVEDGLSMMFHRDAQSPAAMVEVKIFGSAPKSAYEKLTASICDILSREAGVDGSGCYVKFEEVSLWGYDSFMF